MGDRPAARRANLRHDLLGGRGGGRARAVAAGLSVVVDDDGGAEPGQFQGLGAAEPPAGAGDDRTESLKRE